MIVLLYSYFKMKKILFAMLFLITACTGTDIYKVPDMSNFQLVTQVTVPVKEGYKTLMMNGNDTVYFGNVPVTIDVPKYKVQTRSVDWYFVKDTVTNPLDYFQSYRKGTLVFEDVSNGDNDYNDFVGYVSQEQFDVDVDRNTRMIKTIKLSSIGIYPRALGGSITPISLGFEIIDGYDNTIDDIVIYKDIRKEAFRNEQGYLNTGKEFPLWNVNSYSKNSYTEYHPVNLPAAVGFKVNYYLVVHGRKIYTADSSKGMLTRNGVPYGLFIPGEDTFKWMRECVSIEQGYPNFVLWKNGEDVNPFGTVEEKYLWK